MHIYLNGEFVEASRATISPFDHGYLYGLGVFETFRTYGGEPFLLEEHVERLNAGLREMGIATRFTAAEVRVIVRRLSELNSLADSYIRLNVSAGIGEIGLQTDPYTSPTVILFQKPLATPAEEKEAVIVRLPRNTPETGRRLKSHHFFNNAAAKREVGSDPQTEGIFLTGEGDLAEGVTSNLFWVKDDKLFTPAVGTGILDGITRGFVIKLAKRNGIAVTEGFFKTEALGEADEIFFTNSVQEIVPVFRFAGKDYPGKNGELTKRLRQAYREEISRQSKPQNEKGE